MPDAPRRSRLDTAVVLVITLVVLSIPLVIRWTQAGTSRFTTTLIALFGALALCGYFYWRYRQQRRLMPHGADPRSPLSELSGMQRFAFFVAIAAAGLSWILSLRAWRIMGRPNWQGLTSLMGGSFLLLAFVVGPQRRTGYYMLLGACYALLVLSLAIAFWVG